MTFDPTQGVSIHGRRLALNTTGAIMTRDDASTSYKAVVSSTADAVQDSSALLFTQLGVSVIAVASSVNSTLAHGLNLISSGTATAPSFEIQAPIAGVSVEVHIDTSASEFTFGSCTTAIVFKTTLTGEASTMFFTALADVDLFGVSFELRGITTTQWNVKSLNLNRILGIASTLGTNLTIG